MTYRSLGTATTNSEGVATFTLSPTGVGKMQVYGTADGVESERYNLYDTIKYDIATDKDYKDIWTGSSIATRIYDGTELQTDNANARMYTSIDVSEDFCIEFNVKGNFFTNTGIISIRTSGGAVVNGLQITKGSFNYRNDYWYTVRIEVIDKMCTITSNNITTPLTDVSTGATFNFRVSSSGSDKEVLKFNNWRMYRI